MSERPIRLRATTIQIEGEIYNSYSSAHADVAINAGAGNDLVSVHADYTHVTIDAGAGNDTVTVGTHDSVFGGYGVSIVGGDGNDSIAGSGMGDTIDAGNGNDIVDGYQGDDSIIGGAGNDSIYGAYGNDFISDTVGNNTIDGGEHLRIGIVTVLEQLDRVAIFSGATCNLLAGVLQGGEMVGAWRCDIAGPLGWARSVEALRAAPDTIDTQQQIQHTAHDRCQPGQPDPGDTRPGFPFGQEHMHRDADSQDQVQQRH